MLDTIISIILFILAFGILICIHEAGHLSMAKLFKVYCKEYSIGFGPKIFSRLKEGKETRFSIRAIPFGGYVSMYGEGLEDDPEFKDIPKERSLECIKKWKKAIILSAGVILNAVLAFILIFISNFAFPQIGYTRKAIVAESSLIAKEGVKAGDKLKFIYPKSYEDKDGSIAPFTYQYTDNSKLIHAGNFFIVDSDVTFNDDEKQYVAAYMFSGNKNEPHFSDGLMIFEAIKGDKLESTLKYKGDTKETDLKSEFISWYKHGGPEYYPNYEKAVTTLKNKKSKLEIDLNFEKKGAISLQIPGNFEKKGDKLVFSSFKDIGLSFERSKIWLPVGTRFKNTFEDYGYAAGAVFKGLGVLFTGGIRNMSGIVGIFSMSSSLYTQYTFSTYLFFWGLISVNLAIFNLLPFPGLDGWQLLVTAIEGISHRKIPAKFKTIMSLIGIGLLFALMAVIIVLDVLRIVGV